jgi:cell division protein FtsI (penicillin-binding protein 3)
MMERVTQRGGTATYAGINDYRVAGKTGTARVLGKEGYDDERHVAWFAGLAPASDPRIVMVVLINEPDSERTSGGKVAAPIFARVAERSLRLLGVPPDNMADNGQGLLARRAE